MKTLKEHLDELFEQIKHGDQEHQDWLHNKIQEYLKEEDEKDKIIQGLIIEIKQHVDGGALLWKDVIKPLQDENKKLKERLKSLSD